MDRPRFKRELLTSIDTERLHNCQSSPEHKQTRKSVQNTTLERLTWSSNQSDKEAELGGDWSATAGYRWAWLLEPDWLSHMRNKECWLTPWYKPARGRRLPFFHQKVNVKMYLPPNSFIYLMLSFKIPRLNNSNDNGALFPFLNEVLLVLLFLFPVYFSSISLSICAVSVGAWWEKTAVTTVCTCDTFASFTLMKLKPTVQNTIACVVSYLNQATTATSDGWALMCYLSNAS